MSVDKHRNALEQSERLAGGFRRLKRTVLLPYQLQPLPYEVHHTESVLSLDVAVIDSGAKKHASPKTAVARCYASGNLSSAVSSVCEFLPVLCEPTFLWPLDLVCVCVSTCVCVCVSARVLLFRVCFHHAKDSCFASFIALRSAELPLPQQTDGVCRERRWLSVESWSAVKWFGKDRAR